MYENIEAAITCTGELGKSDNDTALGGLVIQIRYKVYYLYDTFN
jgi:hypothetical protein